jgi:hypothetical protein
MRGENIKLCKDCQYFKTSGFGDGCYYHTDPVNGGYRHRDAYLERTMRDSDSCGPIGQFFSKAKP